MSQKKYLQKIRTMITNDNFWREKAPQSIMVIKLNANPQKTPIIQSKSTLKSAKKFKIYKKQDKEDSSTITQ